MQIWAPEHFVCNKDGLFESHAQKRLRERLMIFAQRNLMIRHLKKAALHPRLLHYTRIQRSVACVREDLKSGQSPLED